MMMMAEVGEQQRRREPHDYHLYNNTTNNNTNSNNGNSTSNKKLKTGTTTTTTTTLHDGSFHKPISSKQEKNDKFGERVAALQQLVSPFGKTDTASVLSEATGYIRFLHEQLQVLSAPYIGTPTMQNNTQDEKYSLRRRGLCLMPITATQSLSQSNGADLWAPTKHTSYNLHGVP
ncbi:transcription factor bHLH153 isoform X1 [Dioscorea cayenensis subsp. rotundata]|uniref:Transcription factor bHLH153 isoform X1 n=1 Tax=Dioscorea cayennensis subsp. rotundata TaxID=55577 RepID=A0AB40B5F2_DIOCR|nr:transcription factor bHLH153 isoform X1 [Dioscorea cayenensis subsp. rotundata]XP_039122468.1 transcription factor bHLH153 isoform X1 [Dioscorea cayenensis subsp. rotundata]